jgi:hypothetical protein
MSKKISCLRNLDAPPNLLATRKETKPDTRIPAARMSIADAMCAATDPTTDAGFNWSTRQRA